MFLTQPIAVQASGTCSNFGPMNTCRRIVQFRFQDAMHCGEIWLRVSPRVSPPTDGLEVAKLSRLNVAGGNIRNVAINAAFLAADACEPVRMSHLLHAARTEYAKLEKTAE